MTTAPEDALRTLAEELRDEETVISPHVRTPDGEPSLGLLVAAGPRSAEAPGEYAIVIEAIREGYLLHYGEPRIVEGADPDLRLLAGDYLYARGLERLAALGDLVAVRELADLISLSAQLHAEGRDGDSPALWLASAVAIGIAVSDGHEEAKAALRQGGSAAAASLVRGARDLASEAGISALLDRAAEAIDWGLIADGDR